RARGSPTRSNTRRACSPTAAMTMSEPMPAIVVAPMLAEPSPSGGAGVTANEPEQTPATMPDSNADSVEAAEDDSAETVQDATAPSGAPSDQPAPADSPFGEASLHQCEPAASRRLAARR